MNKSQQFAIYRAETETDQGALLPDREAAQEYYDRITESDWFNDRFNWIPYVEVLPGSNKDAGCTDGEVAQFSYPVSEQTLVHELAHIVVYPHEKCHGPNFVEQYLLLTYLARGQQAWEELRTVLESADVDRPELDPDGD